MKGTSRCWLIWFAAACLTISPIGAQTVDTFNATANNGGYTLVPQPNGKVLAGGHFTVLDGQPRNLVGRLNNDGTLDPFNPDAGAVFFTDFVECFGVQADGKILVGGSFSYLGGQLHLGFGRVDDSGMVEKVFSWTGGFNVGVDAIAIQPDGKILIAGGFTANEIQRTNLARLNQDGSLDTSFNSNAGGLVRTMALQPDGKILLAGEFTNLAGQFCSRLNTDGTLLSRQDAVIPSSPYGQGINSTFCNPLTSSSWDTAIRRELHGD